MKKITQTLLFTFISTLLIAQPCANLFFSEYIEGSGTDKGFEIYNPSSSAVNLSNYVIYRHNSAATTPNDSLKVTGMLAAGATYVIADPNANGTMQAAADTTDDITFYGGDDALALWDINLGAYIDIIGTIDGNDPGQSWPVGTGSTQDYTLVRKNTVQQGTTNWVTGAGQWNVFDNASATQQFLGTHTMTPCGPITDTTVVFSGTQATVNENVGTANIDLNLNLPSSTYTFTVDVELMSGDATQIDNYTTQTVTFANTITESLAVTVTNDTVQEAADTLVFKLTNAGGNLLLGADSIFTLIIAPNDAPIAQISYTIATVRGNNTDGIPDSNGVYCRLSGIVYGVNINPGGLGFTINDGTAGIGVFAPSSASNFGYTVNEGDSIAVLGTVGHNKGGADIGFLDTVIVLKTGVSLPQPQIVNTAFGEDTEGELIQISGVGITRTFSSNASGTTYEVTDDDGNAFEVRIDADVNIDPNNLPSRFGVIGIGSQFYFPGTTSFTSGYQISPRYAADIIDLTSINTLESLAVSVSPNPVHNFVMVSGIANESLSSLAVYNVAGQQVKNIADVTVNNGSVLIDAGSLDAGMYIINGLTLSGKQLSAKFIKE